MTIRSFLSITHVFSALLALLILALPAEAKRPYTEEEREPRRLRLVRPAQSDLAAQLEHADVLRERGRLRRAQRQYRALVRYWPNTPEAALAQYRYAQVLEERDKPSRAFDQYEYLMEHYTGMFPHKEVLERKFEIAEMLMERRRAKFFIFPGFHAPERAIPFFESIVEHGPQWERAAEAQLNIGRIKERIDEWEEAVFAYDRVEYRYPRSKFVEEAAYGKARSLVSLAQEYPNHLDGMETAMHALAIYLRAYPNSAYAPEARNHLRDMHRQIARITYNKARYYDRVARQPKAAMTSYERFLEQFPDTEWSDSARDRLEILRTRLGDPS